MCAAMLTTVNCVKADGDKVRIFEINPSKKGTLTCTTVAEMPHRDMGSVDEVTATRNELVSHKPRVAHTSQTRGVHVTKSVQCWDTEIGCAQSTRPNYLIFSLWSAAAYQLTFSERFTLIDITDSDLEGATVAERLTRSPPTEANRAQCPVGSPDFRKWESCRTMLFVGGFSRRFPISPRPFITAPLHIHSNHPHRLSRLQIVSKNYKKSISVWVELAANKLLFFLWTANASAPRPQERMKSRESCLERCLQSSAAAAGFSKSRGVAVLLRDNACRPPLPCPSTLVLEHFPRPPPPPPQRRLTGLRRTLHKALTSLQTPARVWGASPEMNPLERRYQTSSPKLRDLIRARREENWDSNISATVHAIPHFFTFAELKYSQRRASVSSEGSRELAWNFLEICAAVDQAPEQNHNKPVNGHGRIIGMMRECEAVSKYRNRMRLERASQKQSSDTHKTPYDRVKRCRERKINIKTSGPVNVDNYLEMSGTMYFKWDKSGSWNQRQRRPANMLWRHSTIILDPGKDSDGPVRDVGAGNKEEGVSAHESACKSQHARVIMQDSACKSQRARVSMQESVCRKSACKSQHAIVNIQESACKSQHARASVQESACKSQHPRVSVQESACRSQLRVKSF
ncbi:hypothetical protein PR048_032372 [Dryococelus australis]|uniref:Uncharacterized protein n=1 Tax=Dryococelus australis TaxID=614101 RepID=A0ABQ9G215_9NEOP|nr:hypothetical protein PR048_032372 [Dryococelus australis]